MKTYARLQNDRVAELLSSAIDPSMLFFPSLQWIDITGQSGIQIGYMQSANGFVPPPQPAPVIIQAPTLVELQAELNSLSAQIASLTPQG